MPGGLGVGLSALSDQFVETQCQANEEPHDEQKPRLEDLNLQIVHGSNRLEGSSAVLL